MKEGIEMINKNYDKSINQADQIENTIDKTILYDI